MGKIRKEKKCTEKRESELWRGFGDGM